MCDECSYEAWVVDRENEDQFRYRTDPGAPSLMDQLSGRANYVRSMISIQPDLSMKGQWKMVHKYEVDEEAWLRSGELFFKAK